MSRPRRLRTSVITVSVAAAWLFAVAKLPQRAGNFVAGAGLAAGLTALVACRRGREGWPPWRCYLNVAIQPPRLRLDANVEKRLARFRDRALLMRAAGDRSALEIKARGRGSAKGDETGRVADVPAESE